MLDHLYNEMIEPAFLARLEQDRLTVDGFCEVASELAHLFRLLGKHPGEVRLLDFGFGYGRWARVARALGATVFATETGEEKKRIAASIGVKIIADDEVDRMRSVIVHTEQVLEHVVDPAREFARLAAVTDGLFKVAVPTPGPVRAMLRAGTFIPGSFLAKTLAGRPVAADDMAFMAVQPLEHLNTFLARTMAWLAAHNGLRLQSRVRRRAVMLDLSTGRTAARATVDLAKTMAKGIMPRDAGGYLLRPGRRLLGSDPAALNRSFRPS